LPGWQKFLPKSSNVAEEKKEVAEIWHHFAKSGKINCQQDSLMYTFFKDSLKLLNSVGSGSFLTFSASRKSRNNFDNNGLKHAV
jgi:hypothetical protein